MIIQSSIDEKRASLFTHLETRVVSLEECDGNALAALALEQIIGVLQLEGKTHYTLPRRKTFVFKEVTRRGICITATGARVM